MSRYIDAEYNLRDLYCYFDFSEEELDAISTVLKLIPTADVVPSRYGCGNAPSCSYVFEVDEDE